MEELLNYFHSFLLNIPTDSRGTLTGRKLSHVSIKNYLSDTRRFLGWLNSTSTKFDMSSLVPASFSSYYQSLKQANTPLSTINRHLSSLRRFGTFLSIHYNTPNPALNLPNLTIPPTPSSLINDYHLHLKSKKLSTSTVKNYLSDIDQFLNWVTTQGLSLKGLRAPQVDDVHARYHSHLSSTTKTSPTINRHLISLKKFLTFLAEKKILSISSNSPSLPLPSKAPLSHLPFYALATSTAIILLSFTIWQTLTHLPKSPKTNTSTPAESTLLGLLTTAPSFPPVSFGRLLGSTSTRADTGSFNDLTTHKLTVTSTGLISPQTTTIGTSTILQGQSWVTIPNHNILPSTQIYLTPTSESGNLIIYVKDKLPGISFTIATPKPTTKPLTFNYWLIQTQ